MAAAVKQVVKDVKQVANAAGDAVKDVAKFVEKEVIKPVVKAVENTVKAIEKDPIGTIAQIATAIVAPQFLPLVSGANTLAHGGSVEDALKSAAITYVGGKVATAGANIGANVAKALDVGATAAKVATNVGAAVGSTVVAGGDVGKAVTGAIVGTGVGELTNSYLPPDTSAATKKAVSSAVVAELQGRDPVQAMANSYVGSGTKYAIDKGVDYVSDAYKNLKNPPNNETSAYYTPTEKTNNETSAYYKPADPSPMLASNNSGSSYTGSVTTGALPTSKGIELASSDSNFSPEINVQVSGTPIFADDPRSAKVEPPPGYRLVNSSEGTPAYNEKYDANVDPVKGTFYDISQNAWFTKDEAQTENYKRIQEELANTKPALGFGDVVNEEPQNPDIKEADEDKPAITGSLPTMADRVTPLTPLQVDNAPTNNDSSGYYTSVNNDSSSYYTSPLTSNPELDRADEGDVDLYTALAQQEGFMARDDSGNFTYVNLSDFDPQEATGYTVVSDDGSEKYVTSDTLNTISLIANNDELTEQEKLDNITEVFGPGMSEEDFINSEEEGDITFDDYVNAGTKYTTPTPATKSPLSPNEDALDSLDEVVVRPGMDEEDFINSEEEGDITLEDYEKAAERYTDTPTITAPFRPTPPSTPGPGVPVTAPESPDPGATSAGGTKVSASSVSAALPVAPQGNMLSAAPLVESQSSLQQLTQLYPQLANVRPDILQMLSGSGSPKSSYYTYGGSNMATPLMNTSISSSPGPGSPLRNIGTVSTDPTGYQSFSPTGSLMQQGLGMIGYKKGGPVSQHVPEFITGETGYYVRGKGDGQSDDIPAMLADGEYVFDADVVAALGNGSNEAGAEILDKMREAIRKHKRSAPPGKIPPKAKSPLEYLKDV